MRRWRCDFWKTDAGKTMRPRLEPMKRVARMLRHHQPLIRNWFVARGTICGGVVEGLNKQAKLIIKKRLDFGS
ncbi:MAG: transposase [Planctomycetaceae bacterium]